VGVEGIKVLDLATNHFSGPFGNFLCLNGVYAPCLNFFEHGVDPREREERLKLARRERIGQVADKAYNAARDVLGSFRVSGCMFHKLEYRRSKVDEDLGYN
jgi:hypothetical protein